MLRFKPDVRIVYFTEQLDLMLRVATLWSCRTRIEVEVNSIDDPARDRADTTLHGKSLACDFDTVGDTEADTRALADYFRVMLPPQFDVVWEGDHVHVEWDVRRGPLRKSV